MDRQVGLLLFILALASASTGCGMAMGQGAMTAKHAGDAKELDAPLAVGGSIQPDVHLQLTGTAAPALDLVSARPAVVSADGGRLTGLAPGVSAILVTTKDGEVLDFYHLWVEKASRATLHRLYKDGRDMGEVRQGLDLVVGESVVLSPKVYAGSQELAGTPDGTWAVTPPVASVLREGVPERRRLVAMSPGKATLTVKLEGVTVSMPLGVLPAKTTAPVVAAGGAS